MQIYDISPLVSSKTAVFPGDTPYERTVALHFDKGHNLVLSSIRSTVHIGAHADAPIHYHPDGVGIAERQLERYLGPCQVISVAIPAGKRIGIDDLNERPIQASRVLFRSGSFPDPEQWVSDFNSFCPDLLSFLADEGVILVGIDTPSIDPETSGALESHQMAYRRDLAILEGLVLLNVPDGLYYLSALPLKLESADASPVRAVLLSLDDMRDEIVKLSDLT